MNDQIEGRVPLCLASDYGQLDVLNFLISCGANIDVSANFCTSYLLYDACLQTF